MEGTNDVVSAKGEQAAVGAISCRGVHVDSRPDSNVASVTRYSAFSPLVGIAYANADETELEMVPNGSHGSDHNVRDISPVPYWPNSFSGLALTKSDTQKRRRRCAVTVCPRSRETRARPLSGAPGTGRDRTLDGKMKHGTERFRRDYVPEEMRLRETTL